MPKFLIDVKFLQCGFRCRVSKSVWLARWLAAGVEDSRKADSRPHHYPLPLHLGLKPRISRQVVLR